ncbi:MAG: phosphotransferase [Verrucomicrobiota bacterium]
MEVDTIIALTRQQIPDLNGDAVSVTEIAKGGSDRRYFRMKTQERSLIFCQYGAETPENSRFAQHTDYLEAHQVSVPTILARDPTNRRLWIEDLGELDLWSFRNEPWPVRRRLYEKTLDMVSRIHALRESHVASLPVLGPEFNEGMYGWEQDYFFDNFAANFSRDPGQIAAIRTSARLLALKQDLEKPPRCLIHRDFQSQNVIIQNGEPVFIDYQGLRFGLAEYDLASLIFDPYVPMTAEEREELISYAEARSDTPGFRAQFYQCACQRLMQALGAYGFLGLVKQKTAFLEHIPPAVENLRAVAINAGALPELEPLLHLRS